MVLRPETDPETGELRLVGTDLPENITFLPGELGVFTQGVFFRGGDDTVQGSSDPELIRGNQDNDLIRGAGGNDTLFGGQGRDRIIGEGENDSLFGERDDDIIFGNAGEDTLFGGPGNDEVSGGEGNDIFFGGEGIDTLNGDEGEDLIQGDKGADILVGGLGNDQILGGLDADRISGEAGDDVLRGDQASDFIEGGEGNDLIFGGQGDDRILADAGDDRIYGDKGRDTLIGGEGNDIFFIEAGTGGLIPEDANFLFDYEPGIDTIALLGDFPFESLNITVDPRNSNNTLVQAATGEYLAVIQRVQPDQLTRSDFFIPGSIAFNSTQYIVSENGTPINPITVTRSIGEDGVARVTLIPTPVGILNPGEVDTTPLPVIFANGDTTPKSITLEIQDDNIVDYSRELQLSLENPTGSASIGIPAQATLEILDDEPKIEPLRTLPHFFPEANANFGFAVEQVTTNILVGAPGQNNTLGSGYLYDAATGQPLQIFNHPFPSTAGNAQLGRSVAAYGADVVLGAPNDSISLHWQDSLPVG
ncbi:MAG: calcium-binding protein [Cyanobacteriota bacterium]|nr:calcium-binding protein [Cyanobacteriota bacterium]